MNWSWIAGFFDGEGCVSILLKRPTERNTFINPIHSLVGRISQKDRAILEKIERFVGYNLHITRGTRSSVINLSDRKAEKFFKQILPYSNLKNLQIRLGLQFIKYKKHEWPLSKKELRWREMHRQLISCLNMKKGKAFVRTV